MNLSILSNHELKAFVLSGLEGQERVLKETAINILLRRRQDLTRNRIERLALVVYAEATGENGDTARLNHAIQSEQLLRKVLTEVPPIDPPQMGAPFDEDPYSKR